MYSFIEVKPEIIMAEIEIVENAFDLSRLIGNRNKVSVLEAVALTALRADYQFEVFCALQEEFAETYDHDITMMENGFADIGLSDAAIDYIEKQSQKIPEAEWETVAQASLVIQFSLMLADRPGIENELKIIFLMVLERNGFDVREEKESLMGKVC